jgi:hypothetical protein
VTVTPPMNTKKKPYPIIKSKATINYHCTHIQYKDFGGVLSIPSVKRLNKTFGNTTISSTQSQSHLATPITK